MVALFTKTVLATWLLLAVFHWSYGCSNNTNFNGCPLTLVSPLKCFVCIFFVWVGLRVWCKNDLEWCRCIFTDLLAHPFFPEALRTSSEHPPKRKHMTQWGRTHIMFSPDTQYPPNTYSVSETCLHHTLLITFSGTLSVIGVDMKPGSTQLHLIPNLEERKIRWQWDSSFF